jgi:hypothetical protein
MSIDPKEKRAVAGFIPEYAKRCREIEGAKFLLRYCQEHKAYPHDFQFELNELKNKPEYQKIARNLDLIADRLEQAADEADLIELVKQMHLSDAAN